MQNPHRYFFYAAVLISLINTYDAILAFHSAGRASGIRAGQRRSSSSTSSLLWVYTLSCHSCRHIVGGRLKHFSKHPVRYRLWTQVSQAQHPPHAATPGSRSATLC